MNYFQLTNQPALHRRAKRYKEEFLRRHFGRRRKRHAGPGHRWPSIAAYFHNGSNVVGVGFGLKEVKGVGVGEEHVLRIYVRRKRPLQRVSRAERIPPIINGLPTDVIEVGTIRPARPAMGGCSGGNRRVDPGTLGCLVRGRSTGREFIMSCFHVLADIGNPILSDLIYEAAWQDGGRIPIGKLHYYRALNAAGGNLVDCAVASIDTAGDFTSGLQQLGPTGKIPVAAANNQQVVKSGRDYPYVTRGTIMDVMADVPVDYPQGRFNFVKQIVIRGGGGVFAGRGDSGALVVLDTPAREPVGLLFAVGTDESGNSVAFANPIGTVLEYLNVEIA